LEEVTSGVQVADALDVIVALRLHHFKVIVTELLVHSDYYLLLIPLSTNHTVMLCLQQSLLSPCSNRLYL